MTGDPGAYSGTDGDPGAYARPDTDSPLDALLDAYVEASVNHYLASKGLFHGTLAKRNVHAARAAILAEFATLEARLSNVTTQLHNLTVEALRQAKVHDALRAEVKVPASYYSAQAAAVWADIAASRSLTPDEARRYKAFLDKEHPHD